MKYFLPIALCAAALLAGCESMSDRIQNRISVVPPKVHTFAAPQAKVTAAAQQAFKRLDFQLTRNKPGQIEAVSRINSSAAFANARQLVAGVRLFESGPGQTDVEITLREETSSQSFGGTGQQPMRDHSFFALYFAMVQQVLEEEAQTGGTEKP